MSGIEPILISTLIGSIGALAGGLILLLGKRFSDTVIHVLVSFAAGALLGNAFFELLPEALHHAEEASEAGREINIFLWTLLGIMFFYLLERGIHWFQHSKDKHKDTHGNVSVPLVILGDSVHNFIDGVAIAITFLVNPAAGITTAFAVVAHELPQEIGDFAILLHEGLAKKKVLLVNIGSAILAVLGAIVAFSIGERIEGILPYALSITAGFFIYIALNNLLPEIHGEEKKGYALWETGFLLLGVLVIYLFTLILPHGR
jgi:zinc and cadmium transporter